MYPEGNDDLHIDLVLYVASAKEQPNHRYFEVINQAKAESKKPTVQTVPILTVLTKYDLLTAEEISCKSHFSRVIETRRLIIPTTRRRRKHDCIPSELDAHPWQRFDRGRGDTVSRDGVQHSH